MHLSVRALDWGIRGTLCLRAVKNFALGPDSGIMQFWTPKTLSFNLMYVAACYPVGTGMCHNMEGLLQHY